MSQLARARYAHLVEGNDRGTDPTESEGGVTDLERFEY